MERQRPAPQVARRRGRSPKPVGAKKNRFFCNSKKIYYVCKDLAPNINLVYLVLSDTEGGILLKISKLFYLT